MAIKKRDKDVSFDVTVESVIGTITLDEFGEKSPIVAAFDVIGTHQTNAGENSTYRFPLIGHSAPNAALRVAVTFESDEVKE